MQKLTLFSFIFTVDITVYYGGYHGDLNETFFVGEVDEDSKKLVRVTHECLQQAIDIGKHIEYELVQGESPGAWLFFHLVLANISKTISTSSDWFLLIMSHTVLPYKVSQKEVP